MRRRYLAVVAGQPLLDTDNQTFHNAKFASSHVKSTNSIMIYVVVINIRRHRLHAVGRCGLLLQMSLIACVEHIREPCKNGRTARNTICSVNSCRPKKSSDMSRLRSSSENCNFEGNVRWPARCDVHLNDFLHSSAAGAVHFSPAWLAWLMSSFVVTKGDKTCYSRRCRLLPNDFGQLAYCFRCSDSVV